MPRCSASWSGRWRRGRRCGLRCSTLNCLWMVARLSKMDEKSFVVHKTNGAVPRLSPERPLVRADE